MSGAFVSIFGVKLNRRHASVWHSIHSHIFGLTHLRPSTLSGKAEFIELAKDLYGVEWRECGNTYASLEQMHADIIAIPKKTRRKMRKAYRKPNTPPKTKRQRASVPKTGRDEFYASWEWRTLRMEVLKEHGRRCMCCGAAPGMETVGGKPIRICVDHIQPLSKRWDLRLVRSNLQVLCDECNQGKGAWDESDYRPDEFPEEPEMTPIEIQLGERLRVIPGGKVA